MEQKIRYNQTRGVAMINIQDFLPNIKCPHCGKHTVVAISGFGGELNTRDKQCKECKIDFYVHILVTTSIHKQIVDGEVNGLKDRIGFLRREREKSYVGLLTKYEFARKINEEALLMAMDMKKKAGMN